MAVVCLFAGQIGRHFEKDTRSDDFTRLESETHLTHTHTHTLSLSAQEADARVLARAVNHSSSGPAHPQTPVSQETRNADPATVTSEQRVAGEVSQSHHYSIRCGVVSECLSFSLSRVWMSPSLNPSLLPQ